MNTLLTLGEGETAARFGDAYVTVPVAAVLGGTVVDTTTAEDTFEGYFLTEWLRWGLARTASPRDCGGTRRLAGIAVPRSSRVQARLRFRARTWRRVFLGSRRFVAFDSGSDVRFYGSEYELVLIYSLANLSAEILFQGLGDRISSTFALTTGGVLRVTAGRLEDSHGRDHRTALGFVELLGTANHPVPALWRW